MDPVKLCISPRTWMATGWACVATGWTDVTMGSDSVAIGMSVLLPISLSCMHDCGALGVS